MTQDDYRSRLKSELARRKMVNSRYSLRAFAKAIGLSAPYVSKVLAGQKSLSIEAAVQVSEKLGYSKAEAAEFCQLVQIGNATSSKTREILEMGQSGTEGAFVSVELETFAVMSDWYHFAILELSTCKGFKSNVSYIAQKLKISVNESEAAVYRLIKLGLLKEHKGRWKKNDEYIATPSDKASQALRNFHAQMIRKAQHSMANEDVSKREITGLTFAIDPQQLQNAKMEVRKFLMRMAKLADSSTASQVMQLNVQLFSLSELSNEVSK